MPAALEQTHPKNRIRVLDAFRAVAILAVVLFHYMYRWGPLHGDVDLYGFAHQYPYFRLGYLGVEFFFIISGFVIYMTLERCSSLIQFFARRFARLYPAYLAGMLIVFFIVNVIGPPEFHSTAKELAVGLTMQSQQFNVEWVDGVFWSLFVETRFYFWAGIIYLVSRKQFDRWWCVFAALAVTAGQFSDTLGEKIFVSDYIPYFTVGLYFYRLYINRSERNFPLLVTGVLTYLACWYSAEISVHVIVLSMVLAFYAFIFGWLNWLAHPILLFFGEISYSLYLVHQYIGVSLIHILRTEHAVPDILAVGLAFAACCLLALAITRFIEHDWKRRISRFTDQRLIPWITNRGWHRWIGYESTG